MISVTAAPASSRVLKIPRRVRTPSGRGRSATSISAAIPKHPSEPTKSPTRSSPPSSRPIPPRSTSSPSGSTTVSPVTYRLVTPYLRQWGPPEFSATFPPGCRRSGTRGRGRSRGRGASGPGQVGVHHSGLDPGPPVRDIQLQDPVHPRRPHDHRPLHRQGSPAEPGARSPRDERKLRVGQDPDHRLELPGRGREDDRPGGMPVLGEAVRLVDQKLVRIGEHGAPAHHLPEPPEDGWVQGGPGHGHRKGRPG
jgi:hypothetical protein